MLQGRERKSSCVRIVVSGIMAASEVDCVVAVGELIPRLRDG